MSDDFRSFAADRSVTLNGCDPEASLDDLEPLAGLFRDARVVAVGESAHYVREFYLWRQRLLRFLAERCGFTVFAMESGFSEGLAVDDWVSGGDGDVQEVATRGITYRMGRCPEMRAHLSWMREHNKTADVPLRFVGLDVPGSTASPLPALESVGRYLARVDPEAVPLIDRLMTYAEKYAGEHALPSYAAYAQLARADRDRITVHLAELASRFDGLEAEYCEAGGVEPYRIARHELRLVGLLDQTARSYTSRGDSSEVPSLRVSARDRGMAETVLSLAERFGPETKIVVGAANNHIQRTPVATPAFHVSPMGHHLAHRLGGDYVAVAVTAVGGRTSTRRLNPEVPGSVEVVGADLEPGAPGSVEAAFGEAGGPRLLDVREARGRMAGPSRIRLMDSYQETPVLDAFDLMVTLPEITPAEQVGG
jgi:erythromycin esterase